MNASLLQEPSLGGLLKRLSDHFDLLASEVFDIEHAIGGELDVNQPKSAETIARLQRLDYLRQSLEDMALLMLSLAKTSNGLVNADLAQKVRLEATRELILGGAEMVDLQSDKAASGEVDLF